MEFIAKTFNFSFLGRAKEWLWGDSASLDYRQSLYTDEQLAQLLKIQFSLPITRRTVTKYRKIAGIKSSHQRKLTDKKMGSNSKKQGSLLKYQS
ncbi:MAG: hypothetical protein RM049_37190 [Nostoc sp. DedQUE04]|uniref:RNA polymerase factor sigma-54 n=1 Tax=Nostoc sp. DedQUE04 TaxID=3075390 RepID=UPI002AD2EDA3|nr:hypothetical protein [Nostoc sp. DedQUE04]MDZ8140865.1 hypothetical protein [Nostoc sp. DedQUE04]